MSATYDLVSEVSDAASDEVFAVYDAVFGDLPDRAAWRRDVWDRHTARPGFRLARAYDAGRLVGFGYGFTGERGQWWTDQAARVLEREVAEEWLGGHFELVSIGVRETARGAGVGRRLLDVLCDGLPHRHRLLMTTADADDPARHLYQRAGWEVLGPGLRDGQVILGQRGP